jgi:hypothetical protein
VSWRLLYDGTTTLTSLLLLPPLLPPPLLPPPLLMPPPLPMIDAARVGVAANFLAPRRGAGAGGSAEKTAVAIDSCPATKGGANGAAGDSGSSAAGDSGSSAAEVTA